MPDLYMKLLVSQSSKSMMFLLLYIIVETVFETLGQRAVQSFLFISFLL